MTDILDLPSAWRGKLRPASFGGARFHCESNSREGGRRIVEHVFPKKDLPYGEDMGRSPRDFTVRGYIIVYPSDSAADVLKRRNYLEARDALLRRLEAVGPTVLQLPTQPPQLVNCNRFRMAEEDRAGGLCIFDMTFSEAGLDPQIVAPAADTAGAVNSAATAVEAGVGNALGTGTGNGNAEVTVGPIEIAPP
jgi:prophage DNA circulation protein